jgi:hypothetical protein
MAPLLCHPPGYPGKDTENGIRLFAFPNAASTLQSDNFNLPALSNSAMAIAFRPSDRLTRNRYCFEKGTGNARH